MAAHISRRQFLRADFRAQRAHLRPPWALPEDVFVERCTRGGDCVRACPQTILEVDAACFPAVNFAQAACIFCAACVEACTSGALTYSSPSSQESLHPWQAKALITDRCLTQSGVFCEVCRESWSFPGA